MFIDIRAKKMSFKRVVHVPGNCPAFSGHLIASPKTSHQDSASPTANPAFLSIEHSNNFQTPQNTQYCDPVYTGNLRSSEDVSSSHHRAVYPICGFRGSG